MLAGMEINGKPVELSCHEACLPLCSAIGGSDVKMPCWLNDNSSKIFGKKVDTPGSAAIVALVVLLAMALGFIGGQKIDVKSVRRKAGKCPQRRRRKSACLKQRLMGQYGYSASKADTLQKSVEGRQD
jgi:hypothetical protein